MQHLIRVNSQSVLTRYLALILCALFLLAPEPSLAARNSKGKGDKRKTSRRKAQDKRNAQNQRKTTPSSTQKRTTKRQGKSVGRRVKKSKRGLHWGGTQRIKNEKGSTLFVSANENLIDRVKKTMGWKKSDKVFSIVFIGGAGANSDPATEIAYVEIAKAYARAYKRGDFGDFKLMIGSGAAPGLPDAAMQAFRKIAPDVPLVGYSPYKDPANHMKHSPWKGYDFMRLVKPVPHVFKADASEPAYSHRQDAMLTDASLAVAAGGRSGTGEEVFQTLERGKALVLVNEGSGVGVSGGMASVIERSARAGKSPLMPVFVTPKMENVKREALPRVATRVARQSVAETLANLSRGPPERHTEANEAKLASNSTKMIKRLKLRKSERAVGEMDALITARVAAQSTHGRVAQGLQAIRRYANIWQVDKIKRGVDDAAPRFNSKRTARALAQAQKNDPSLADVTMKDVRAAWNAARRGEKRALSSATSERQPYMSLRVGKLDLDRPHVTRLSLANPGPQHATITAFHPGVRQDKRVIVHHEVIDREGPEVQPYRSPSLAQTKRLTYWLAGQAPLSVYLGLPNVPRDLQKALKKNRAEYRKNPTALRRRLLTPATSTASNARARFSLGAAEVKVRVSPKQFATASQMVEFMVEVNKQMGDSGRLPDQVVSAQFNLNEPIIDDLGSGKARRVSSPVEVAKLSLRIMETVQNRAKKELGSKRANAWRKWAPDSAFDKPGTRTPFIELLGGMRPTRKGRPTKYSDREVDKFKRSGTSTLIGMVAQAHEAGFETYISAGMDETHMKWATYAGVDGVGIGTALHERITTANASIMGDLSPAKVSNALDISAKAEKHVFGQGSRELYRMAFNKSRGRLKGKAAKRYERLLSAMKSLDEGAVTAALKSR